MASSSQTGHETRPDPEAWRASTIASLDEQIGYETRQRPRERLQEQRDKIAAATADQIAAHLQRRLDEAITRRLDKWAEWTEDSIRYRDCTFENFVIANDKQKVVIDKMREFASNLPANIEAGRNLILVGNCGTGKDHLLFALMRHHIVQLGLKTEIRLFTGAKFIANNRTTLPQILLRNVPEVIALSDPILPGEQARYSALTSLYQIVDESYRRCWPIWCTMNASCDQDMIDMLSAPIVDRLIDNATILHCDWSSYRKPT